MTEGKAVRVAGPWGLFLLLLTAFFLSPSPAAGGIVGSFHDFSGKSFAPGGACSACHREHYAPETKGIWSRDLAQEGGYFDQVSDPDYVPGGTLLCYDCHVDYITSGIGVTPDNDPPNSGWNAGEEPQDVAFTDGPESPPQTSLTGYYELIDGTVPSAGTNDPPTPPLFPPVTEATGGHFWKGVNGDTPTGGYNLGDKLDCSICHDPHDSASGSGASKNEVMLRNIATDGTDSITIGFGLTASTATRNWTTGDGRDMCAGCHQYSEDGVPKTLFGVQIPIPPAKTFDGHSNVDTTECTACHPHNAPDCGACHGYPPGNPPSPTGYEAAGYSAAGGINERLGPHPRHGNEPSHLTAPGYEFDCLLCHSTFGTIAHPNGDYQNVDFDGGKNPDPSRGYTPASRECANLYCHSRGTTIDDTVNNSGVNTVTWTDANWDTADLGCEACHGEDTGPRPVGVNARYGAPGYDNRSFGSPLKSNSHDQHPYICSTCHYNVIRDANYLDGWTIFDESLHVSNDTTTFTFNVDPDATGPMFNSYTYLADGGTCDTIVCHGGNSAKWGDSLSCGDCHYNTAGGDVDNWDLNDLVISQISSAEYESTGHGLASGWFPWPQNYTTSSDSSPIDAPNLGCVTTDGTGDTAVGGCHTGKVPHGLLENPFRLATPNNTNFWFEGPGGGISQDSMNELCWTCHDINREQTHGQGQTSGNNWGDPTNAPLHFKCIDCHDPHGDVNDYMIHEAPFADSSRNDAWINYGLPSTDPSDTNLPGGGVQPGVAFDVTEPDQEQADYVNLSVGDSSQVCQVCHQSNAYFTRSTTTAAHNAGVECIHCHPHNKGIQPLCEVCHSRNTIYHPSSPQYPGSGDAAPQVMGNGTDPVGASLPFDDGDYGYNINGHGAVGAGGLSCTPDPVDPVGDPGCHDISIPAGTHLDGTLNTYNWPDKPDGDTTNTNTSHLMVASAIADGFFASTVPGNDYEYQTFFDDSCAGTNRGLSTGCHPADYHRHEMVDGDRIMRFGDHSSNVDAKEDQSPPLTLYDPGDVFTGAAPVANDYWAPWTIDDLTTNVGRPPAPGAFYFGTCVSCHDPHGTNPAYVTDQGTVVADPVPNHMLRHNWKSSPGYFCASQCHKGP